MHFENTKLIKNLSPWPLVSVFVAARNEELHLANCLSALQNQNYQGSFEVWVADDQSEDQTFSIAMDYSNLDKRFHCFTVPGGSIKVKGKAQALGLIAEKAKGDLFLFCDADMEMPETWMETMVDALLSENVDMVNGTTATRGENSFSALQAIDWLLPQGTFAWMSQLGITYTAMGNNMGITRIAYEATGGYLKIPFSLTEDFELFKQARMKGFELIHLFRIEVFGKSAPQANPVEWLGQHVRWMVGFNQLPFRQQLVFYLQLLFYPLFFFSFFSQNPVFYGLSSILFLSKYLYSSYLLVKIKQVKLLFWLPLYELVFWPAYVICWLKFSFGLQVKWKGRTWDLK